MELPSIGMIKRFVAADAGLSIISESFAKDYVKAGEVKLLTVEGVDLWRELGLVYRRDRSLPAPPRPSSLSSANTANPPKSAKPPPAKSGFFAFTFFCVRYTPGNANLPIGGRLP